MKLFLITSLLAATTVASGSAVSMTTDFQHSGSAAHGQILLAQVDSTMTEGEVRKVDKDAKKVTIKHGEIKNLGMPPMTMVFQVKDPSMLDQIKQGDKVRFHAEQISGAMVVTQIQLGQ